MTGQDTVPSSATVASGASAHVVVWPCWVFVYVKPAGSPFSEALSELTTQLDSLS